ncbi:MAG: hypothetical protein LBD48_09310 [Treponema sp.]|jgi:hypothetical protein|nr:hypothetical protein [Treponema sp.]
METIMRHEMTITVDDTTWQCLRPFVERQTIGELLGDFARSRLAKPPYNEAELEAGYRAMAADAERETEARQWCEALIGDSVDETR